MIIPKATFLKHAYHKNRDDLDVRINNEYMLIMGRIVNSLRTPQNHKLGSISYYLSLAEYPLLVQGVRPDVLDEIKRNFESAGYIINLTTHSGGITIQLDWTGEDDSIHNVKQFPPLKR